MSDQAILFAKGFGRLHACEQTCLETDRPIGLIHVMSIPYAFVIITFLSGDDSATCIWLFA